MKRILLYVLVLAAVCIVPVERLNVGDLEPIQAVAVSMENGKILLETDTDDRGTGSTVHEALDDMKRKSLGIIYLDTAQFLLVTQETRDMIGMIKPHLKDSVRVCLWGREGTVQEAAKYMQSHKTGVRLDRWIQDSKIPEIPL